MNQTAAFEEAVRVMRNLRAAAAEGDADAVMLLALADANQPAFVFADLSKWRQSRCQKK